MHKALRWSFVLILAIGGATVSEASSADVTCGPGECTNAQDGDNDSGTGQAGTSASGDAVAGQVTGVVSSGETSVDATNHSEDVDVATGDTTAANDAANFTGQNFGSVDVTVTDVDVVFGRNAQDGDNSSDVVQAADATSGDAVGGSVIGVVTSAGGSADVVAANTSEDVGIETGDADSANDLASLVGQETGQALIVVSADVTGGFINNALDGDNDLGADQAASASSGDGVGGQVLGVVSAGDASLDATNESTDIDLETGDGDASNDFAAYVGQNGGAALDISATDVAVEESFNAQDGDNSKELTQDALASTGDAVGGQVAGVVTSAGGSADLVLANTSADVAGESGDADFNNTDSEFVGQSAAGGLVTIGVVES